MTKEKVKGGKNNVLIVAIICITLIAITALLTRSDPVPVTTTGTTISTTISTTTTQSLTFNYPVSTTSTTTANPNPTTVVVVVEQPETKLTTAYHPPRTTRNERTFYQGSYYYPVNTPSKAGLVLRSGPSSSYTKLGVIQEYEVVSIVGTGTEGGYINVYAVDRDTYGWVLADYLSYYGNYYQTPTTRQPTTRYTTTEAATRFYPTTASVNCSYRYVSYDTPSDAGINLRRSASSSSELLCTIKEGETVVVYFPMSEGDYIEISYTNPSTGITYYGWALKKYITK